MPTQTKKPEVEYDANRLGGDAAEALKAGVAQARVEAEFESGYRVGAPFWHGLGTVLESHPKDPEKALELAGANWDVYDAPVFVEAGGKKVLVPNKKGIVRADTHAILGIVGGKADPSGDPDKGTGYRPFLNRQAFGVAKDLLQGEEILSEAVIVLKGGTRTAMLFRLPETIMIGDDPDETVDPFIALLNSFDGSQSFTALTTDVIIACSNTTRMAIAGTENIWYGRHTKGLPMRVEEMRQVLRLSVDYYAKYKQQGDAMLAKKMSQEAGRKFIQRLVPIPAAATDPEHDNTRVRKNKEQIRELIRSIHDGTAPKAGQFDPARGENIKDTAWGWYNAVSAYEQHYHNPRGYNSEDKAKVQKALTTRFQRTIWQPELLTRAESMLVGSL